MRNKYQIEYLTLTNFKKYSSAKFSFGPGLNIITGKNGVGKTSILDAIRMLVFGKSYFSPTDKSCISHEQNFLRAEAKLVDSKEDIHQLVMKLQEGKAKVLEEDGKKIKKLSSYLGTYLSVCVSPDDIILVNGLSSKRREFIDQAIVQFDKMYTHHLIQYTKAVQQRNALLKMFLKKGNFDSSLLEAFDRIMEESAPYICEARSKFMEEFKLFFDQAYLEIAPDIEQVQLTYESKLLGKSMKELLEEYKDKDRYSGRSNAGVHKDELQMSLNGKSVKSFGSQGQIKSFVFALKIALFEYFMNKTNKLPILILDDMFDKLDHSRVEKILDRLNEKGRTQVFITDTDKDRITKFLKDKGEMNVHIHILEDQTINYPDV